MRGGMVFAWLGAVAALLAVAWSSGSSGSSADLPPQSFGGALATTLAALVIVPALWCVPIGAAIDHYLSRFGALAVAVIHALGCILAFMLVMTTVTVGAAVTGGDIPQDFALLALFLLPETLLVGYLLAMLVPGSFPRHPGRRWSGLAPALRAIGAGWDGILG